MRQCMDHYGFDVGVGDKLNDYHEARFVEGPKEVEPQETAKAYYAMLCAAQKLLCRHTKVSQLDAIACLMVIK